MNSPKSIQDVVFANLVPDKVFKEARADLAPGEYPFSFSAQAVIGVLKVFEDTEKTPTSQVINLKFIAKLVKSLGCTREAVLKATIDTLAPMMQEGETAKEALEGIEEFEKAIEEGMKPIQEHLATLPKTKVKGKALAKFTHLEIVPLVSPGESNLFNSDSPSVADTRTIEERIADLDTLMAKEA